MNMETIQVHQPGNQKYDDVFKLYLWHYLNIQSLEIQSSKKRRVGSYMTFTLHKIKFSISIDIVSKILTPTSNPSNFAS